MRAAEFQAAQQRMRDAEDALQKAADTDRRAQETREVEAAAAATASAEARQAEANLSESRAAEDKAVCDVSHSPPLMCGSFGAGSSVPPLLLRSGRRLTAQSLSWRPLLGFL